MRANPSSLRLQSSQAPALFRPHPALLASADCLPAPSTLRPKKIPLPPPPLLPKHVASAFSLRPSPTQTLSRTQTPRRHSASSSELLFFFWNLSSSVYSAFSASSV